MKIKKIRSILFFTLIFVFAMGIIFAPSLKKFYKENISKKYSEGNIEYFDLNLFGATGWAGIDLPLRESSNNNSNTLATVSAGQPFMILGIDGDYWEIMYGDNHGYVEHDYCLINLPDVLTKARYDIKNAYYSVYRTKGDRGPQGAQVDIPGVTGEVLYGTNCYDSNGNYVTCSPINDSGDLMNNRLKHDEYIVPVLYSTSLQIARGADAAESDGYRLKIYDSYRPYDVSAYVSTKFKEMYNNPSNTGIRSMIDTSYNNADNAPDGTVAAVTWNVDDGWFISNVNSGTHISDHNVGAAIDVSLCQIGNSGNNETCTDVEMYSPIHQLSTDSIKYSHPIPTANPEDRNSSNYSVRMQNDTNAQKLDTYLQTGAGMDTLSSEWWHFRDADGVNRMKTATSNQGFNFQATSIVSDYGFSDHITVKGDANGNGSLDLDDAELVYKFYSFLNDGGVCETCTNLVPKLDITEDGKINGDDIYAILNNEGDLITSDVYTFGDDYVDVGSSNFSSSNITLKSNVQNLSAQVANGVLLIRYYGDTIKAYSIVSYSLGDYDLTKQYIYLGDKITDFVVSTGNGDFTAVNANIVMDQEHDKVYIKRGENNSQTVREFDLVYYSSPIYSFTNYNYINTKAATVEDLLSDGTNNLINCHNCDVVIYSADSVIDSGDIPSGSELALVETVTGSDEEVRRVPIRFLARNITLDITSTNLGVGEQKHLTATVTPEDAIDTGVAWSSSNEAVVRVNSNGTITGVGTGLATITAKNSEDNSVSATCNVTVIQKNTVTYIWGSGSNDQTIYYYEAGNDVIAGFNQPELLYVQGKKLVGWQYNDTTYALDEVLEMPLEDIELTAVWEEISQGVSNQYSIAKISTTIKVINGIERGTEAANLDIGLDTNEYNVTIHAPNGDEKTGVLGTGDIIRVWVGDKFVDRYEIAINGDLNGDGIVSPADFYELYELRKKISNNQSFAIVYKYAGDLNGDGIISPADIFELYDLKKRLSN